MTISNLINSVEEDEVAHMELNDSDIIQMVQEAIMGEVQEEEIIELLENGKKEKIKFLAGTPSILDLSIPADRFFNWRIREL